MGLDRFDGLARFGRLARPLAKTGACGALLLCLCASPCLRIPPRLAAQAAQPDAAPAEPPAATATIRVKVDMVSLPVAVTTRDGEHVKDLGREDFELLENGVPQQVAGFDDAARPVSVALMLDTSGSTERQLSRIRADAVRFIRLLGEDDSLAALSFADEVVLWAPFDIYRRKDEDAFKRIKPGGGSAVYEAVWLALEQVLKLEYGRKALVLLSDGVDTRSSTVTRRETLELAKRGDATVYCVYFDTGKDGRRGRGGGATMPAPRLPFPRPGEKRPEYAAGREYLMDLAAGSGGLFIDASKNKDLGAAFAKVLDGLRCQYSLGYYPKELRHDGKFREVTVKVKRPGLVVRAKPGFYDD
ncbi:MAG: VWA domain-containing protein [Acidobacteriota bacterium]|jgi:Ca-activated chloride channel family protein|nr:VWA domain-containing protein [Acidobacteriota bacterium]